MPKKNWYALNGGTKCSLKVVSGVGDLAVFAVTVPVLVWAIYLTNNDPAPSEVGQFVLKQGTATGTSVGIVHATPVNDATLIFPKPVHFPAGMFLDKAVAGTESFAVTVLFEEADPA